MRLSTSRVARRLAAGLGLLLAAACQATPSSSPAFPAVVYQTDFGLSDGAVCAMKGVAYRVEPRLVLEDLTHEVRPFDIWEGSYRLRQTADYWPAGTVFVSVVDPGVGTERKSVVARSATGHIYLTPDNGTLTLVADHSGIEAVREIDARHRLPGSEWSPTFHGRDVYSYTAALLASGRITFEEVGPELSPKDLVHIPYARAALEREGAEAVLRGGIPVLDRHYGNVWTDVPRQLVEQAGIALGDVLAVEIVQDGVRRFQGRMPFVTSFGNVPEQQPLAYVNSLGNLAFALNRGSFAEAHAIGSGSDWVVRVRAAR